MKTKSIYIYLLMWSIFSCVSDSDFATPNVNCTDPNIKATNSIQEIKEMAGFGVVTFSEDLILEGYVISNDESGNIYKTLYIQDAYENPTSGIKFLIDQTNLYTTYNVGRKICVKLKGLSIGYDKGSLAIGKGGSDGLERISSFEVKNHFFRTCEVATIVPKELSVAAFDKEYVSLLVKLKNVQVSNKDIGETLGNLESTETVYRNWEEVDDECNLLNIFEVPVSGFSSIKSLQSPKGKGELTGVLDLYYSKYQFLLRDSLAFQMDFLRCENSIKQAPNTTIRALKEYPKEQIVELGVSENMVLKGYVISSDEYGSFQNVLILQDAVENPTGGIRILLGKDNLYESFQVGDEVFVKLNRLALKIIDDQLTLGFTDGSSILPIEEEQIEAHVFRTGTNFKIQPITLDIESLIPQFISNTLVEVDDVQLLENELGSAFAYFSGTADGVRTLGNCESLNRLNVFTSGNSLFANEEFPKGRGSIMGIGVHNEIGYEFELISKEDVVFVEPYELCKEVQSNILITEIADPENAIGARFVELYNAGDSTISLSGWKLHKYINGSTSVSGSGLDLSAITIEKGGFAVIANTNFETIFQKEATLTSTYISGTGDDVYELVDGNGAVHDVFGKVGEDGTGLSWEYLDGKAIRNLEVQFSNADFEISEWQVFSKSKGAKKIAPQDFSPFYR